jgi:hypothetical protein
MAGSPLSKAITCTHDRQSACHPQCERGSVDGTLSPGSGFPVPLVRSPVSRSML